MFPTQEPEAAELNVAVLTEQGLQRCDPCSVCLSVGISPTMLLLLLSLLLLFQRSCLLPLSSSSTESGPETVQTGPAEDQVSRRADVT